MAPLVLSIDLTGGPGYGRLLDMTTNRTDYANLSPRTLAAIRMTSPDIKIRRAVDAEMRTRGMWTIGTR